jgi:CheY-like chemotaxis protein
MDKIKEVWIVDDDNMFRIFLKSILNKSEAFEEINSFENGSFAIDELKSRIEKKAYIPSIIFLDINMPIMNGWEFMEAFANLKANLNTPVEIYISSSSIAKEDTDNAKNNTNIKGFLTKPIKLETINEVVQKYRSQS